MPATSSNSCELILTQDGERLGSVTLDPTEVPTVRRALRPIHAQRPVQVEVRRATDSPAIGRVVIGGQLQLQLRPGQATGAATITVLREQFGEVTLAYHEHAPDDPETEAVLLRLGVELVADPALRELYETLVAELEEIHLGLARDVMGMTSHRIGERRDTVRVLRPEEDLQRLIRIRNSLAAATERIRLQPSRALASQVVRQRWRPGDRIVSGAMSDVFREAETVVEDGRLRSIGTVMVRRTRLTTDIPEHRLLRDGLRRLRARARQLAAHCDRCAQFLEFDRRRWGGTRSDGGSVFEAESLPRVREYEVLADRARGLDAEFEMILQRCDFLAEAGAARTRLRPTPLFLNRAGYRESYAALREAERSGGALVSGDELRIHFRSLSRLYEYWCFVRVVELCRGWLGTPLPSASYRVIDEVYRPELEPGQSFTFRVGAPGRAEQMTSIEVEVIYEPDVVPADWTRPSRLPFRAALSDAPLRPDVWVEVRRTDRRPVVLVLDAKSTARFTRDDLWRPTDYRTRIFDPHDGSQPVRQVFFLHRTESQPELVNLPGYLRGSRGAIDSSILGAVLCVPGEIDRLRLVLTRFLSASGVAVDDP